MKEFKAMPPWTEARDTRELLINDGWRSPDTYCTFFQEITNLPAIYLFLLLDNSFERGLVSYVGMSLNLKERMNGHEVLRELNQSQFWLMKWFKPTATDRLRRAEAACIRRFDPPWNIVGKRRGVRLDG